LAHNALHFYPKDGSTGRLANRMVFKEADNMKSYRFRAAASLFAAGALVLSVCSHTGPVQPYAKGVKLEA